MELVNNILDMRKIGIMIILLSNIIIQTQAQMIDTNDTIYLNYYISIGEFGGRDEAIKIYVKDNKLIAKSIRYIHSSTSHVLNALVNFSKENNDNHIFFNLEEEWDEHIRQRDSIVTNALIDFYKKNRNDYTVLKTEWVLSKEQQDYITKVLYEIKTRPVEEDVFSNASEHYVILKESESHVFIDRTGKWNKFLEIKKVLDIEQTPRRF